MANRIITAPTTEPVSLEEARSHLRLTAYEGSPATHPDDDWVEMAIVVAREWIEEFIEQSVGTQTREEVLDAFPDFEIELPFGPVHSITSLTYLDENEEEQAVDSEDYFLDTVNRPQVVMPAVDFDWPTTSSGANGIKVRYETGFTNGASPDDYPTPKRIKMAALLLVGHWYENREASSQNIDVTSLPMGVEALLWPLRRPKI